MSKAIARYLIELGHNPDKVARFRANPDAELASAGLSPEEGEILKSGDAARIRAAVSQRRLAGELIVINLAVVFRPLEE
jgi:hypothetical protein